MAPHSSSTPSSSRRKEKQLEDSLGWILLTPIVQFPPVTCKLPFCHIGLFLFLKHKSRWINSNPWISVFISNVLLKQDLLTLMTSHWNLHRTYWFLISLIYHIAEVGIWLKFQSGNSVTKEQDLNSGRIPKIILKPASDVSRSEFLKNPWSRKLHLIMFLYAIFICEIMYPLYCGSFISKWCRERPQEA